ncbi:probable glutamyl endopeptidase chloroplastic [Phtheirospermum japonicum]|uniref:Probable glutamyl endopeptidase chloroplastic n=1 Tax=Phtheirospermum japonicum TaxID=374723 RepID=A0A830C2F5_9LAMI|nr:probable glutamyl endopeptidase chloroplastic [Phtheirospermum japonicum]
MMKMMMMMRHIFQQPILHSSYRETANAGSLSGGTYRIPPVEIMLIVNDPRQLHQHISPTKEKVLLLKKMSLPPISELARVEEKLAGVDV